MNPLNDIRAYLAHFEETAKYAWNFNLTEKQLIGIAFALKLL